MISTIVVAHCPVCNAPIYGARELTPSEIPFASRTCHCHELLYQQLQNQINSHWQRETLAQELLRLQVEVQRRQLGSSFTEAETE